MTAHSKQVLLAEDDQTEKELLYDLLKELCPDIRMYAARTGTELIRIGLELKERLDVIVLKHILRQQEVTDILKKLNEDHHIRTIPKAVWGKQVDQWYIDHLIEAGASGYFIRPDGVADKKRVLKDI